MTATKTKPKIPDLPLLATMAGDKLFMEKREDGYVVRPHSSNTYLTSSSLAGALTLATAVGK